MAAVSFSGLATGLDTASIISQLIDIKRAPVRRLQFRIESFEAQKKALDTYKTKLLALQEAAQKLDSTSEFSSLKASSGNEDALTVSADSDAAAGTYDINVTKLAKAQKDVSQGFDSKLDSMGSGIMSFTVNGETTDLTFVGYTSLESLAEKINNDVAGVSASIVYDGSESGGYRLVMSSSEAGTENAFSIDMSGMSGGVTPIMTNTQVAENAELTVDGISVVASSNSPDDVISGLTLDLKALGEATIKIETDTEGIAENVKGLVDAYNDIFGFINSQNVAGGDLRDNPTLRAVASRLESIFTSSFSDGLGSFSLFSQVGIKRDDARQLEFDEAAFTEALKDDFASVRDLFIEREGNLGKTYLIDQAIDNMTDSIDGLFRISNDALTKKIDYADDSIERYERGIESYRITMERKFSAMELMVSQLNAQGSYLSSIFSFNQ